MSHSLLSERARTVRSSAVRDLLRLTEQPHVLSLAGGLPAPELLPVERIAEASARILAQRGRTALQYGPTEGIIDLRELVSDLLGEGATAEDTIITTGSQQGLDLIARTMLDPGDVVVTEMPTYLGALSALHWVSPRIVGIEGDRDGLRTDVLAEQLAAGLRPKLVYVVTDFANPTGATLSLDRRRQLAVLAERYDFVIVEDNPYGALRFRGERHPSIRRWSERAVTLGSASKILSPGLRIGWLTAPRWLAAAITIAKQGTDLHTAGLDQHIALELLGDRPWLDRHVEQLVTDYGRRAEQLAWSLRRHCGDSIVASSPDGGMFVWAELTAPDASTEALLPTAIAEGMAFVPGSAFRHDGVDGGRLRLCFTTQRGDDLDEAVRRLARAIQSTRPRLATAAVAGAAR